MTQDTHSNIVSVTHYTRRARAHIHSIARVRVGVNLDHQYHSFNENSDISTLDVVSQKVQIRCEFVDL